MISVIRRRRSGKEGFSYWVVVPQEIGDQLFSLENPLILKAEITSEKGLLFRKLSKGES